MRKITTIITLLLTCFFLSVGARECGAKKNLVAGSSYQPTIIFSPYDLTTNVIPPNQIELSWVDNSDNETGFEIERRIPPSAYSLLATVGINVSSYSDATVLSNTTYYYRVRAFNTNGVISTWSNEASATILVGDCDKIDTNAAIRVNGTIWVWGNNYSGQLGLGDTIDRYTPAQIGTGSDWSIVSVWGATLSIKTDNTLWAWGGNDLAQLGLGDTNDRNSPTQIGTDSDWYSVVAGISHTIALKTNRTIWSWGANLFGELGLGDTMFYRNTPSQIGNNSDWSIIASGAPGYNLSVLGDPPPPYSPPQGHTFAIKTDGSAQPPGGTLWAWGYNADGQLGLGYTGYGITSPTQVGIASDWAEISAEAYHTIARKTNGTIWGWGYNNWGQLGLGYLNDTPILIPTQIGADSDWSKITTGGAYTLVLKINGTLWECGIVYKPAGQGYRSESINTLTSIGIDADWSAIATSGSHNLAIKSNRTLWAWGLNYLGQLGLGDTIDRFTPTLVPTLR